MTATDMPVTALAPWAGAKRNPKLHDAIVDALGKHRAYFEVPCGSMAVLLSKPRAAMETVCELNGDLINLARVVVDPMLGPQLYRRLRRHWLASEIFDASAAIIKPGDYYSDLPNLERALHYFIFSWFSRAGVAGTKMSNTNFCTRYTIDGGAAATRFESAVRSIPAWRRRMRGVTIIRDDLFKILRRIEDSPGVAIYCDPPYLVKGFKYLHEFTPVMHARLAKLLRTFRNARCVVSYYAHPWLDRLYPRDRWARVEIEVSKSMAHQASRNANDVRATELLLVNDPHYTPPQRGLF